MHAIDGNPFMIRTWSMVGSSLFINVKKDNNTILHMSMGVDIDRNSTLRNGRMMLKYNQTIQELYLLFENISKEDQGIYKIQECYYTTFNISDETEADTYDRKDGRWYLEIYVLGMCTT
ncbi:hypothetical protein ACJMK2_031656 [Sinanodonta woodiana]|uniref:Uncharacterized protein n=1 Tax=Sinanodonta woodiana TaxID=1069815 RepID=A0ABD3X3F5_SINWO